MPVNTSDTVCSVMLNVDTEKVIILTIFQNVEKHARCILDKKGKYVCISKYFNSIAYKPTNGVAVPRLFLMKYA